MTERESSICNAAREAVHSAPRKLKDVAEFVNELFLQRRLGNPVSEEGVAATIGKFGRATLKQFTRDGEPWVKSFEPRG